MKVLYGFIAAAGFGFFAWLLVQMGSGTDSGSLGALAVSFALVLVAMGAAALMSRRDDADPHSDRR